VIGVPEQLRELEGFPGADEWLARLPELAEECIARWSLCVGPPFAYASVSLALPAQLPDGTDAVLKISFPHWESEHEAAALAHWDGDGAVRLLDYDQERRALLLERCRPGTSLLELPEEEGYRLAADVLPRLWSRPAPAGHPFTPIAETAARWARELPERWKAAGRPFERSLLDEAVAALVELPPSQPELVVCHQDFHRGNVLAAERRPWLAIDPKPVVAERAFDTAALLRDGPGDVAWRLDFLAALLDLDRERVRGWGMAHTMAWGFAEHEPVVYDDHVEIVRALSTA
jgi:streptomycin 6-kinase